MSDGILNDIRVVEVGSWIAAPAATLLLAEAGADVIKVEPPGGDPARTAAGFATWNRSKRSAVIDLHAADGRAELQELLRGADILVHSLRPSAARRVGLADEQLARDHPGLIWCAITGWPHGHPDEDRPGYEVLLQAATGVMDEELGTRPGPVFLRFPFGSWNAAFLGVVGVLARLRVRDATGRGGPVHTSLFQGAMAPMSKHWSRAATPTPSMAIPTLFKGMNFANICADDRAFSSAPMADVPVTAVPLFQEALAEMPADSGALIAPADVFRRRERDDWLQAMWALDLAAVPVNEQLGEALRDEQSRANGYAVDVEDPQWGATVQAGPPFHIDPPMRVRGPAPRLGQHTEAVLGERRARPQTTGSAAAPRLPLEGVKVLDFGMYLAGPYGPQLMADLGADVVKVEATTGDRLRSGERVFSGCQRGKRSVAVDLRSPETRPILEKLVRWADVVHHNLRQPPARQLGLDYESVARIKPEIIYCHVSSYGPSGPRKDWPGVDPTSQAVVGWMQEGAGPGNPPRWYRIGMTDDQCAINSVTATLLALRRRDQTGQGSDIRASILGTALLTTSEAMLLADGSIAPYPRMDKNQTGLAPGYRIFQCTDGWIAVAALGDKAMAGLHRAAGVSDDKALETAFAGRAVADMAAALAAEGVEAEPVRMDNATAFFDSELYRRLGLTVTYEHPIYGRLEQIGAVLGFGDLDMRIERPPPVLGQHTAEVLNEVGVPKATCAALAARGLLAGPDLLT